MVPRSILICDPDSEFLQALRAAQVPQIAFLTAVTAHEAQRQIADRAISVSAICLNPALADPGSVPLIRFSRLHRPATPISLLTDDESFPPPGLDPEALQVQAVLRKPILPEQLVAALIPVAVAEIDRTREAPPFEPSLPAGGRETTAFLQSIGLSEESLKSARRFVERGHMLTSQIDLRDDPRLTGFVNRLRECDHATGVSMIVSVLLDALEFRDPETISAIALGAFLHDIGIHYLSEGIAEAERETLSAEHREELERHPSLGADAIAKIPQISPLVSQIVRQHHERRDRKGYPAKLGPGEIAPLAEIVGLADQLQTYIENSARGLGGDPLAQLEGELARFSSQTAHGFRKAFSRQAT